MKGTILGSRLGRGCFFLWAIGLLVISSGAIAQEGPGYRLSEDRLVVETAAHWRAWTLPTHAVEVEPTGVVVPHRFRSRYNLLNDRATFQRALKDFKRGRTQTAILNLDSTLTLDIRGNVLTQKKSGKNVPVYTYLMRMGISRVGSMERMRRRFWTEIRRRIGSRMRRRLGRLVGGGGSGSGGGGGFGGVALCRGVAGGSVSPVSAVGGTESEAGDGGGGEGGV